MSGGSVECDFTDIDQCGYVDISDGPTHWLREYDVSNKGIPHYVTFLLKKIYYSLEKIIMIY